MPAFIFASAQDIRVNIDFTKASLGSVLNEIGRQTSLSIVYNTGDVNPTQPVSIKASNENITTVMNRLLRGTGLSYSIMNKHLILSTTDKNHSIQQEKVTVTGNISDAKGEPLIGVSILVKGTSNGTITDMNGHFSLPVAKGDVIEISYIGYAPQAITVTDSKPLKIVMKEDAEVLDEVVVTALGIKRAQKALSYNVQQVGGDAINTVKDANFINSLQGKVAGVTINNSAGGVGSASRVVMRGTKSITKDNNALYVIDGIPMFNVSFGKSEGSFATQSGSDGVADLNPDDIESINMLTGPSAAALYGNAAANGVVLINTKKGSAEKTTLTVSNNTMFSDAYMMPEMQNRYGNNPGEFASWGNKTKQSYDPSRFFNTGVNVINAISFSTGTKKNQTYASASTTNATGILPNNSYSRYNFSIRNTATFLKDRLTLDVGASYIIQNDAGDKLVEVTRKASYPIYVKDEKRYGVQMGNTLVYIPKSAIAATKQADNTGEPVAKQIPVFMYHYFYSRENGEVPKNGNWLEVNDFEAHLKYLKEHNYVTLRMQDVENFLDGKVQLPKNSVSITIDDGTASIYKYAYPLLKKYGNSATLFLIGNHLKDDKLPQSFQEMKQNGMELQSHSYDMHTGGCEGGHGGALRCVAHDEGVADTEKSFSIIGGGNVYCYPYGDVTDSALQIMKDAGVHMAFTTNYGKIEPGMDKLQLPRVRIFGDADIQQFIYSLES